MAADSRPQTRPRSASLNELALAVDGKVEGNGATRALGIEFDSRQVREGDLFVALRGADFDGHDHVQGAADAGAAGTLVESCPPEQAIPAIVVTDSRAALSGIACQFYGNPSAELRTIGLTGTDGKTTTSCIIDAILREAGQRTGLVGTVGIHIGPNRKYQLPHQTTPESSLVQGFLREMVEQGVDTAIIEATSHGLALHRLDHVGFDIAAVTNITQEHLEYHGTIENYRLAKAILIERTAFGGGVVILNADDPGAMSLRTHAKGAAQILTFSATGQDANFTATEAQVSATGTTFRIGFEREIIDVRSALIGEFNIANALCALAVAHIAGVPVDLAAASLARTPGVPGRLQRVDQGQPFSVIVDYAHTPDSLRKVLSLLRQLSPASRIIVVTGSGGERDRAKRPLQGALCAGAADISIFTNEDPRNESAERIIDEIAEGAIGAGGQEGETFHRIVNRRDAIRRSFDLARPGDIVLLAGKGHERSIIVGLEHQPWDETAVAIDLLGEFGFGIDVER